MAFSQTSDARKKGAIRTVATAACALVLGLALCTTYGCGSNAGTDNGGTSASAAAGDEAAEAYKAAEAAMSSEQYGDALANFKKAGDYQDAADKVKEVEAKCSEKAAEAEETLKTGKRPILSSSSAARIYGALGDDYKTEYNFCMAIYKYENRSYSEAAEFIKDIPADFELGGFTAKDYSEKIASHQE